MLNIKPPDYKFCPFCAFKLSIEREEDDNIKVCPNCGWKYYPHVSQAALAIITKRDKVLLVKRNRDPYKNTWMFPAGFLKYGEYPEEAIVREVREETGLTVKNAKLVEIGQTTDDPRQSGHLVFYYKIVASGSFKNKDKDENSDIGWFGVKNPPKIGWKGHKLLIRSLSRGKYLK